MTASSGSEALANARKHSTYESGMCQKFTRSAWEVGSLYGSAIEAWNGSRQKHAGDRTPPTGAPCYYRGGQYGHAVVFAAAGAGEMRSTDCTTTGKVSEQAISWVEQHWGYEYLGWTGDINGVDLPLSDPSSGGGSSEEDDVPQYDHAWRSTDTKLKAETWTSIYWEKTTGAGAIQPGDAHFSIMGRTYSAVLHCGIVAPQGSVIRMRTSEWWGGEQLETNPQSNHFVDFSSGTSFVEHAHNGHAAKERNLRFEVYCNKAATLTTADAVVLSW